MVDDPIFMTPNNRIAFNKAKLDVLLEENRMRRYEETERKRIAEEKVIKKLREADLAVSSKI